jgi:hypothetical protein
VVRTMKKHRAHNAEKGLIAYGIVVVLFISILSVIASPVLATTRSDATETNRSTSDTVSENRSASPESETPTPTVISTPTPVSRFTPTPTPTIFTTPTPTTRSTADSALTTTPTPTTRLTPTVASSTETVTINPRSEDSPMMVNREESTANRVDTRMYDMDGRVRNVKLTVNREAGEVEVEANNVRAVTTEAVRIEESQLYIGDRTVNVVPDTAVARALETEQISLERVELKVRNEAPVYVVRGSKKARLLNIIPVSMDVEIEVSADRGTIISVTKPWWSFLARIAESTSQEQVEENGCEIDRETGELLCPDEELAEPLPEYPIEDGGLMELPEGATPLDPTDSKTAEVELEILKNQPELVTLDLMVKQPRPTNAGDYPKISPTLLAMYNFVANDCLNNPESPLCPADRSYYYEGLTKETPVDLKLELTTTHSNLPEQFEALGGSIIYSNPEKNVFVGSIGVGRLLELHARQDVSYISRFVEDSEFWDLDDDAINFAHLDHLHAVGQKGEGVKIAVLDLGFKDYLNSQANGNLPAGNKLHYKNFLTSPDITKTHGRKCAEVVHAVAPEAELYLYRASGYDAWEDAIDEAIDEDVDIVTCSIGNVLYGPATNVGWYHDLVKKATDAGILWFQANGNEQHRFFYTNYNPGGDKWLNFMPGDETNHYDLQKDQKLTVKMRYDQWGADGHGAAKDDFDLYVLKKKAGGGWEQIAKSIDDNIKSQEPYESVAFTAPEDGRYHVTIYEYKKTTPGDVEFTLHYSKAHPEYETDGKEVCLPAASPLAISVGAVHQGGVLADYTSRGPTVDGRFKPDFAAPAGFVLPAGGDAIFGTSFSTPFLAGATAVLGDINFKNQAEIYKILKYMTFYQDKDMDNSRGWGVPNFDHTFTDVTCSGYEFTTGGPYRMYCNGYPVYVRKTAFVSLQLAPGTFVWNGAQHESTDLTLTDNTPLLLEYPKWHGLFLSDTGKGQQKVFDIVPQEADSEIHYHMDEAGIVKTGLYKKVGESGKQSLRLSISNN